jgi:hypothetical protein
MAKIVARRLAGVPSTGRLNITILKEKRDYGSQAWTNQNARNSTSTCIYYLNIIDTGSSDLSKMDIKASLNTQK